MGRRSQIDSLPVEQFDFVIRMLVEESPTDRELEAAFETAFPDAHLPKSNIDRWRKKAGNELVERYKLRRYQVKAIKEQLRDEGFDVALDQYKQIIDSLEDHLLTNERDLIAADPVKLLGLRQEDEKLRVKREQIELSREKLVLERQKLLGAATDPVKQGTEFMTELFDYLKDDADGVLFLKKHTRTFIDFLTNKYAEAEG